MTTCNNPNMKALAFGLNILDPLIQEFWGKSVIDFIIADPWNDDLNEICRRVEESDPDLIEKFNAFPRLRYLLEGDAVNDWEAYKEKKENDKLIAQDFDYIDVGYNDQVVEFTEAENEIRRQEEAGWQAFLDEFMSA